MKKDYYDLLEVPSSADLDTIRNAYRRARITYTQNSISSYSLFSEEETRKILEEIEEAYLILSDTQKRKIYDEERVGFKSAAPENTHGSNTSPPEGYAPSPFSPAHIKPEPIHKPSLQNNTQPGNVSKSDAPQPFDSEFVRPSTKVGDTFFVPPKMSDPYFIKDDETEKWISNCRVFDGPTLKKIREYRNIEINFLAEFTKISKRHIDNIEKEIFHELPADAYLRGFLIQISKCYKLDPILTSTSYMSRVRRK